MNDFVLAKTKNVLEHPNQDHFWFRHRYMILIIELRINSVYGFHISIYPNKGATMNEPYSLTLQQVDVINLSLSKAMAVAQMVADCGGERKPGEDEPSPASLFVVMQVIADELEKISEVMSELGRLRREE